MDCQRSGSSENRGSGADITGDGRIERDLFLSEVEKVVRGHKS
jgi:hypothetical protein